MKDLILTLLLLLLCCLASLSNGLICKTCEMNDPFCSPSHNIPTRQCEDDNDRCYSWFHRFGSEVTVQRGCLSTASPEYGLARRMIGDRDEGCVKRMRAFDCFTFCSDDLCN